MNFNSPRFYDVIVTPAIREIFFRNFIPSRCLRFHFIPHMNMCVFLFSNLLYNRMNVFSLGFVCPHIWYLKLRNKTLTAPALPTHMSYLLIKVVREYENALTVTYLQSYCVLLFAGDLFLEFALNWAVTNGKYTHTDIGDWDKNFLAFHHSGDSSPANPFKVRLNCANRLLNVHTIHTISHSPDILPMRMGMRRGFNVMWW